MFHQFVCSKGKGWSGWGFELLKLAKCKKDLYFDCTFYANIRHFKPTRAKVLPVLEKFIKIMESSAFGYFLSLSYLFCVIFRALLILLDLYGFFRMQFTSKLLIFQISYKIYSFYRKFCLTFSRRIPKDS